MKFDIKNKVQACMEGVRSVCESLNLLWGEFRFWFFTMNFWPACLATLQDKMINFFLVPNIKTTTQERNALVPPATVSGVNSKNDNTNTRIINTLVQFWERYPFSYTLTSAIQEDETNMDRRFEGGSTKTAAKW